MYSVTDDENRVMDKLVDAWNAFVELPNEHSDDIDEFRHIIHAAQFMLLSRPERRKLNKRK